MQHDRPLQSISDDELLRRLGNLIQQSRRVEGDLVAHIAEVDERRLYAREASPSMFAYCTDVLYLSEAEAYLRIAAARASREHPILLAMLGDGRLHLTGIAKLAPHLTRGNSQALLKRAVHRSKRQIEELIAEIAPRPDAPALMRRLPERREETRGLRKKVEGKARQGASLGTGGGHRAELWPDAVDSHDQPLRPDAVGIHDRELRPDAVGALSRRPAPPVVTQPLAPARYRVQFTASTELHDKLERLQALMRSRVPDGDLARIIEEAVTEKLERLEARRFAKTKTPRKALAETDTSPTYRHIPAAVRRAVRERDGSRCRCVDQRGRRCKERYRLEFHHRHPYGVGGDHSPENIRLLCRAHNVYLAEHDYGKKAVERYRCSPTRQWRSVRAPAEAE